MGKTLLTPKQLEFLELAAQDNWLTKNYFLGGGTALSEFYLKHRLSEDLDFFSEKEIAPRSIRGFLRKISAKIEIKSFETKQILGIGIYLLSFKDGETLKVDFSYYPFPPIDRFTLKGKLRIASIYDIAVDKIQTIAERERPRDYVDLYFIFKEKNYNLKDILANIRTKYDWVISPQTLGSQFLKVKDIDESNFPQIVAPFDKKDMEDFFLRLAKSLEKEIFVE